MLSVHDCVSTAGNDIFVLPDVPFSIDWGILFFDLRTSQKVCVQNVFCSTFWILFA